MSGDGKGGSGVSGGAPAGLFEISEGDQAALDAAAPFRVRRGGSRKGVPNRRTQAFAKYYQSLGLPDPLLKMGQVLELDVHALAELLACSPIEALDQQRKIAFDLAPYLHSKKPVELEVRKEERKVLWMVDASAGGAALEPDAMSIDDAIEALENQQLIEATASGSHDGGSHEGE